jgi:hypothetical protein
MGGSVGLSPARILHAECVMGMGKLGFLTYAGKALGIIRSYFAVV